MIAQKRPGRRRTSFQPRDLPVHDFALPRQPGRSRYSAMTVAGDALRAFLISDWTVEVGTAPFFTQ